MALYFYVHKIGGNLSKLEIQNSLYLSKYPPPSNYMRPFLLLEHKTDSISLLILNQSTTVTDSALN